MFVLSVGALVTALLAVRLVADRIPWTGGVSRRRGANQPVYRRVRTYAADRPGVAVAAAALAVSLLSYPFVDAVLRSAGIAPGFEFWDFGAYTQALDRWRAGEPLYVENENGGYDGGYLYPPLFLLAVWPFDQLSFDTGARLWELCSVVFLWGTLQFAIRELGYRLRLWERGLLLWALVGFQPLLLSVKQGQVSAFLTGLLTLSLYGILVTMRTQRRITATLSGVCTGAVGVVKLVYAPVGAHLLTDRRRLLGAVGAGVALVGLSVVVFGVDSHLAYVDVLLWGKEDDVRTPLLWLPPYFRPLYGFGGLSIPIKAVGCALVAGLALAAPREASRETFALGVAAMPLLAPRAYTYYLTALVPAVVAMVAVEVEADGRPALPLVACLLLHTHSYGLKLVGWAVPQLVSGPETAMPVLDATVVGFVVSLLQPGVLGAVLLGSLAAVRVGEAVTFPAISRESSLDS